MTLDDGIFLPIMKELEDRHVYMADTYAPFFITSYAMHAFNLVNQKSKVYWEGKEVPNMRVHLLFVAPPGFMKTFYLKQMGMGSNSIFGGRCKIKMGFEQELSGAGLVGTITPDGISTYGAAYYYDSGIIMIDEFRAIIDAMKSNYNSQLETQLLAALDHGHISKRLGGGKLEYDTKVTVWGGCQPALLNLTSGLGRRLCFLLFVPTRADNEAIMERHTLMKNVRADENSMELLWEHINNWAISLKQIEKVTIDKSVHDMYHELGLFSFEAGHFDRMIFGHILSQRHYEYKDTLTITVDGMPELKNMLRMEKAWRDQIVMGVEYIQLLKTIRSLGMVTEKKHPTKEDVIIVEYECDKITLIKESIMVGWNAQQVNNTITDMTKAGLVSVRGSAVVISELESK